MNIRKNIDYSELYAGIDKALAANLSQMELYLELGRLVSGRPERGLLPPQPSPDAGLLPDVREPPGGPRPSHEDRLDTEHCYPGG